MNLTKKNIQKTSGIHRLGKFYKPGQLVTIDRHVYRITKTNELLTCEHCANIYHNKENGVNIVLMVSIVNQLKNIRVELHQP